MDALAVQVRARAAFGLEQVVALGVVVHPDEDLAVQRQAHDRRVYRQSDGVVSSPVHRIDDPRISFIGANVGRALFSDEGMVGEFLLDQVEYEGLGLSVNVRDDVARTLEPDALFSFEPLFRELTGESCRLPRHFEGRLSADSNWDAQGVVLRS